MYIYRKVARGGGIRDLLISSVPFSHLNKMTLCHGSIECCHFASRTHLTPPHPRKRLFATQMKWHFIQRVYRRWCHFASRSPHTPLSPALFATLLFPVIRLDPCIPGHGMSSSFALGQPNWWLTCTLLPHPLPVCDLLDMPLVTISTCNSVLLHYAHFMTTGHNVDHSNRTWEFCKLHSLFDQIYQYYLDFWPMYWCQLRSVQIWQ